MRCFLIFIIISSLCFAQSEDNFKYANTFFDEEISEEYFEDESSSSTKLPATDWVLYFINGHKKTLFSLVYPIERCFYSEIFSKRNFFSQLSNLSPPFIV
jgi:hypothetical protein